MSVCLHLAVSASDGPSVLLLLPSFRCRGELLRKCAIGLEIIESLAMSLGESNLCRIESSTFELDI